MLECETKVWNDSDQTLADAYFSKFLQLAMDSRKGGKKMSLMSTLLKNQRTNISRTLEYIITSMTKGSFQALGTSRKDALTRALVNTAIKGGRNAWNSGSHAVPSESTFAQTQKHIYGARKIDRTIQTVQSIPPYAQVLWSKGDGIRWHFGKRSIWEHLFDSCLAIAADIDKLTQQLCKLCCHVALLKEKTGLLTVDIYNAYFRNFELLEVDDNYTSSVSLRTRLRSLTLTESDSLFDIIYSFYKTVHYTIHVVVSIAFSSFNFEYELLFTLRNISHE